MNFGELMKALFDVKNTAKAKGLTNNQIQELEIVDLGFMNAIEKTEFDISLGQKNGVKYYLLMKKKK